MSDAESLHGGGQRDKDVQEMTEDGLEPHVFMNSQTIKSDYLPPNTTKEGRQLLLDESLVLLVSLVPVAVFLLWLKLLRQLLEDRLQQLLFAGLVLCIAVPDRNLDRVPADRVRDAADVIVECYEYVSVQR